MAPRPRPLPRRPGGGHMRSASAFAPRLQVRRPGRPALVFVNGFAAFIGVGTLLLMLPLASASGQWTSPLEALFTATSAVCVTGLVVVDTGTYWSTFGKVVILVLIQLGGFGFMTSSTILLLLLRRQVSLRDHLLLREAFGGAGRGSVVRLARNVVVFTLVVEAVGALLLALAFLG